MARIDEVRERYESITEQLYKNKETFAEYLKFAGKFYKMPTAQTMTMFATNPKATMVADYDTWKKYGHYVKRGANSIAVLCGNGLKHYFDISQTNGDRVPYQWTLDKQTAQEFMPDKSLILLYHLRSNSLNMSNIKIIFGFHVFLLSVREKRTRTALNDCRSVNL